MNYARTALLLAGMTALFMVVGYGLGGRGGMTLALGFALVANFVSYWFSDKMALGAVGAREVDARAAPELVEMVAALARRAGLPMPRVYVIDSEQPNAFATGRNPRNAAVAVNSGLMRMLSREELAGVIAHELAHIKNRDTLTMTIAATLAGAISSIAHIGMFSGGRREGGLGPVGAVALAILAPMAAMIVQMAVSRSREYVADADGAAIGQADHMRRPAVDLLPRHGCAVTQQGLCRRSDRAPQGPRPRRRGHRGRPDGPPPRAGEDSRRRGGDPRSRRRAPPRHGAYVHRQSAVGRGRGQFVLDPSQCREPHRRPSATRRAHGSRAPVGACLASHVGA